MAVAARRAARSRPLAACLVVAAMLRLFQVAQPAAFLAARTVRRSAAFAGLSTPTMASDGRGGTSMHFFMQIFGSNEPEENAAKALKAMAKTAKKQVAANQEDMAFYMSEAKSAKSMLGTAIEELNEAKKEALQQCEVNWDMDEPLWDADLKSYADPVTTKAVAAQKASISLKTSIANLETLCAQIEVSVENRTVDAKALIAELDQDAQERLVAQMEKAILPISNATASELFLAKAEVANGKRELSEATGMEIESEVFASTLREKRGARCKAEVLKAEAAAAAKSAEEAAAKAAAENAAAEEKKSEETEEEASPPPLALIAPGLLAVAAAITILLSGSGGSQTAVPPAPAPTIVASTPQAAAPAPAPAPKPAFAPAPKASESTPAKTPAPAPPKELAPAPKATAPAPPKAPEAAPAQAPKATEPKPRDDLTIKVKKGELLSLK